MTPVETTVSPRIEEVAPVAPSVSRKALIAALVGTTLEWYDLLIYIYFSLTIAQLFFPHADPLVSLLVTVGAFSGSYLAKPLGALVISSYADRVSPKAALTVTVGLMGISTAMIAFTPTYASIGAAASVVMIVARLMQGFSSGGEYGAGITFIVQRAPEGKRGFFSSFQISAQGMTTVLAGLTGLVITSSLSKTQIADWGWRLPFIFGLLIIPVAVYIRRTIPEVEKQASRPKLKRPVREAVSRYPMLCLLSIGTFLLVSVSSYTLSLYLPTYAVKTLGMSQTSAFAATLLTGAVQTLFSPLFGSLSDRVGRVRVMRTAAVLLAIVVIPAFDYVIAHPTTVVLLASQFILGMLMTAYQAPMPALLCDLFPAPVRTVGVAVAHDFTSSTFGGFTPFLITLLIAETGWKAAPAAYLCAAGVVSAICITAITAYARTRYANQAAS